MAEASQLRVGKDCTAIWTGDGDALTFILTEGTRLTLTNGGKNIIRARNGDGTIRGNPRAGDTNVSTIAISGKMYGAPAEGGSDTYYADAVFNTGRFSSQAAATADFHMGTLVITLANTGGQPGATLTYTSCSLQPGSSVTVSEDGWLINGTWESSLSEPNVATVAA